MGNTGPRRSSSTAPGENRCCCLRFHLTTGHDFLGVYLHRISLAVDEACPFCRYARMYGDHTCYTGLDEYPTADVVSL
ncbi:hypothetical protein TNCV_1071821 [Trichonephila clavipes]|nr:hypothetical protein TNCV_1071821 [Trichonephila clavipes]